MRILVQTDKMAVSLTLNTTSAGHQTTYEVDGDLYLKGAVIYIRYPESNQEMGNTFSTVKIKPDAIKVMRKGDIESEQRFMLGRLLDGYYQLGNRRMNMQQNTLRMERKLVDGLGTIHWTYQLWLEGQSTEEITVYLQVRRK